MLEYTLNMTGFSISLRLNAYRGIFQPEYTSKNRVFKGSQYTLSGSLHKVMHLGHKDIFRIPKSIQDGKFYKIFAMFN